MRYLEEILKLLVVYLVSFRLRSHGYCPLPFWPCEVGKFRRSDHQRREFVRERPKRYVPDELSQVPRERIQAQLRRVPSRMGLTSPKFLCQDQKTGNAKSASQQENGTGGHGKGQKEGKKSTSSESGSSSSSSESSSGKKGSKGNGRRKMRRRARKTKSQENAVGRGPSHPKMTRNRERCVQRTNEASCN